MEPVSSRSTDATFTSRRGFLVRAAAGTAALALNPIGLHAAQDICNEDRDFDAKFKAILDDYKPSGTYPFMDSRVEPLFKAYITKRYPRAQRQLVKGKSEAVADMHRKVNRITNEVLKDFTLAKQSNEDVKNYFIVIQAVLIGQAMEAVLEGISLNHPQWKARSDDDEFTVFLRSGFYPNISILDWMDYKQQTLQETAQEFGLKEFNTMLDYEHKMARAGDYLPLNQLFADLEGYNPNFRTPYLKIGDKSFLIAGMHDPNLGLSLCNAQNSPGLVNAFYEGAKRKLGLEDVVLVRGVRKNKTDEIASTMGTQVNEVFHAVLADLVAKEKLAYVSKMDNEFCSTAMTAYYEPLPELANSFLNPVNYQYYEKNRDFAEGYIATHYGEEAIRRLDKLRQEKPSTRDELNEQMIAVIRVLVENNPFDTVKELEDDFSSTFASTAKTILAQYIPGVKPIPRIASEDKVQLMQYLPGKPREVHVNYQSAL